MNKLVRARRVDDCNIEVALLAEQLDTFAGLRVRDHLAIADITGKELSVRRNVEMNRPFIALEMIPCAPAGFDFIARDPEILATWRLQIIPDRAAIAAEELVAGDFHVHCADM